jgi:hypothetical protein
VPEDHLLLHAANNFGRDLRNSTERIIFEGRNSRTADSVQTYTNNYSNADVDYNHYRFRAATFCEKEHAVCHDIKLMKVLGHMIPPMEVAVDVNSFDHFESGKGFFDHVHEKYGNGHILANMRSAVYHQQFVEEDPPGWYIFEGHIDKNFVHTAWFIPLTNRVFYTIIAVPRRWNIPPHIASEQGYQEWLTMLADEDKGKLVSFKERFLKEARQFMREQDLQVLVYYCCVGTFLSFPANQCYHATITTEKGLRNETREMKDLLIVYPTESG